MAHIFYQNQHLKPCFLALTLSDPLLTQICMFCCLGNSRPKSQDNNEDSSRLHYPYCEFFHPIHRGTAVHPWQEDAGLLVVAVLRNAASPLCKLRGCQLPSGLEPRQAPFNITLSKVCHLAKWAISTNPHFLPKRRAIAEIKRMATDSSCSLSSCHFFSVSALRFSIVCRRSRRNCSRSS